MRTPNPKRRFEGVLINGKLAGLNMSNVKGNDINVLPIAFIVQFCLAK